MYKVELSSEEMELLLSALRYTTEVGYEWAHKGDWKEGVEEFEAGNPDLVLLDLLLPDMHGFEVLQKIRQNPDHGKTKVIILSNLSEGRDVEEAKKRIKRHREHKKVTK